MERLIRNTLIFCGIVGAIAGFVHLAPKPDRSKVITEAQLEQLAPQSVMGKRFNIGNAGPNVTYRMDEESYEILEFPSVVCRQFDIDGTLFDVVLIASRSKDAFHDPNICFAAQRWIIERRMPTTVKTEKRGEIPITVISMVGEKVRRQLAAYVYQGPNGFTNDTNQLKLSFLMEEMRLGDNLDGVFYRFIPYFDNKEMSEAEQTEKLKKFIANYMDEAYTTSNGVL